MGTTERRTQRADARARELLRAIGRELRDARRGAGLSQRSVGDAGGMSHAAISRVEWGHSPHVPIQRLARLADVVGLDLTLRAYPSGDPVRDAGQIALLRRFRARLHPSLGWTTEVPLPIPGDRRAWDACIDGQGWRLPIEAETSLRDLQALDRRLAIKARDGGVDRLIVIVNGSHANRRVLSTTRESLRSRFPLDTRAVLAALADAARPSASGIVVL